MDPATARSTARIPFGNSPSSRHTAAITASGSTIVSGSATRAAPGKARPGKKLRTTGGKRYPAVSSAENSSTPAITNPSAPGTSASAAEMRYHLLKKPPKGGIPTSDSDSSVKHTIVAGSRRPRH